MNEQTLNHENWLFEVQLTHRRSLGSSVSLTSCEVHIPRPSSRVPAAHIASSILASALKQRQSGQTDLFTSHQGLADWQLRFAHKGAVDEFTLGVQAVFLDPNSEVVGLFAMHFPEEPL